MLRLHVFGASPAIDEVAHDLREIPGSRHVIRTGGDGQSGEALVMADLVDDAVDPAMDRVRRLGVRNEDVALIRLDSIGPSVGPRPIASVVWTDLLSQAGANARPLARYFVFMAAAGVIAAFGVIYANTTLIVGAMAISPDTLTITAAATGLVLRRWRLAGHAVMMLIAGLGFAGLVGGVMTFALRTLDLLPSHYAPGQKTFLAGIASVNISTPLVALAAGIAGMLALETRASSAVGVAISVTTIPASAYFGVAAGYGDARKAGSALLVLGINLAMLLVGASATLVGQRALAGGTASGSLKRSAT